MNYNLSGSFRNKILYKRTWRENLDQSQKIKRNHSSELGRLGLTLFTLHTWHIWILTLLISFAHVGSHA